jgi:hypothetical protein
LGQAQKKGQGKQEKKGDGDEEKKGEEEEEKNGEGEEERDQRYGLGDGDPGQNVYLNLSPSSR